MYDGRDGVVTDENGLLYMRARYYSPELRRFINADIMAGNISNAITLNRYAYANGNPVSNIDPFGLSAERGGDIEAISYEELAEIAEQYDYEIDLTLLGDLSEFDKYYDIATEVYDIVIDDDKLEIYYEHLRNAITSKTRPQNISKVKWDKRVASDLKRIDNLFGKNSHLAKTIKKTSDTLSILSIVGDVLVSVYENQKNKVPEYVIAADAVVDGIFAAEGVMIGMIVGAAVTAWIPGGPIVGMIAGAAIGALVDAGFNWLTDGCKWGKGKTWREQSKEGMRDLFGKWFG